jgi:hypothetical protein
MLRAFVEAVGEIPFPCGVLENMDIGTQEALDDYAPMVTQAYSHDAGEFREARLEKTGKHFNSDDLKQHNRQSS